MSGKSPNAPRSDAGQSCAVNGVSRLLEEEPRLEAVALRGSDRTLSVATIGSLDRDRIARRVSDAVSESPVLCGEPDERGRCKVCGMTPQSQSASPRVVVKSVMGGTLIEKNTCTTAISFWRWIELKWPKYVPREHHPFEEDEDEWKTMAWLAGGCLLFGVSGIVAGHAGFPLVAQILFVLAYISGGWDAAKDAWERVRSFQLDVHFLMLAVATGAACIGAWKEGALLLFLFSASGAMEHFAMGRTRREIGALLRGAPKTARVLNGGVETQVAVADLRAGMTVLVTAGEQIPADIEILKGETACDESNLTGEAIPVDKRRGDRALAGTLNLWGAIEGRVLRPASESALQKIITLIQQAQGMRAPSQRFTDRFGTGYTWAILGLCATMFFVWWKLLGLHPFISVEGAPSAFYRCMTLLVVASPCALVLSVPSSILSAIASGARRGILFRGGAAIESLANVDIVALDKTGTLTSGNLSIVRIDAIEGDRQALLGVAYSLARLSEHPLSRAIRKAGTEWEVAAQAVDGFENLAGSGVRGRIGPDAVFMGSRKLAESQRGPQPVEAEEGDAHRAGAEVWIGAPGVLGRIVFQDEIRDSTRATLEQLRQAGVHTVMLTGDHEHAAREIGGLVGIDEIRSGLLPGQKVEAIQQLKAGGAHTVAMVGDGVNDAPCIAAADVGVAMGARGSDAALEQAGVVLMNDRLENFLLARELSQRSRRIIHQNITIALGTVFVMVVGTFFFPLPLALGVAAHEGSTVVVVLNSLRLLMIGRKA